MAQLICNICHLAFNSMSEYDKHVLVHTESLRDPLLVEREKTHGSFSQQGRCAQKIKEVLTAGPNYDPMRGDQREALDMIATKISRLLHGDPLNKDTWDDIAGYAKLGSEACDG